MTLEVSKLRYIAFSVNISGVYIALGLLLSLQPPFYPSEAEAMGATPAEYGFVFGIANLSLFIFSPIFGKYGTTIGPKLCFNTGAVIQGVSGFLFAFLPYTGHVGWFIGLSYLLRFMEGVGTAMAWSSSLGILMKIFPNKVARVMSWTQTCFGLGYMLGPGVGAALYELGGFTLPFIVVGAMSIIFSMLLILTIPNLNRLDSSDLQRTPDDIQLRMSTVIRSISLILPFVDLFAALCGNGMLESMLEPHLTSVGASTVAVGVSFLIFGLCYMIGNVVFGTLIDNIGSPILFSVFGNCLFLLAFVFIGPLPFTYMKPTEVLIQGKKFSNVLGIALDHGRFVECMMALAGTAYACMIVSSFSRAQKSVLELGFPDGINTHVMISGVWLSAFSLGNFVGPTLAGFLVQTQGFRGTTTVFFSLYAIMILVDLSEAFFFSRRRQMIYDYESID